MASRRSAGRPSVRQALRHRPGEAATLLVLAALVTAAATFAPLFVRAMEQAAVSLQLSENPVQVTGLTLTSRESNSGGFYDGSAMSVADPLDLVAAVPAEVRRDFGEPILGSEGEAGTVSGTPTRSQGQLFWWSGACRHLRFVAGGCPSGPDQVAVSAADADTFHLEPGSRVGLATQDATGNDGPTLQVRVAGVYEQVAGDYWFGRILTGKSGRTEAGSTAPVVLHDDWLASEATFAHPGAEIPGRTNQARLPIARNAVGIDEMLALAPGLDHLGVNLRHVAATPPTVDTGLPDLVRDVRTQRHQARVIVPIIVVQLVLLALFVLWLVLGAVTDQRRPELALALLRGRGRRGARRQLFTELALTTLAGVPVGGVAAVAVCAACRHLVLPGGAPLELTWPYWASLAGVAALLLLVTAAAVLVVTRQPVESLLRRVASRNRRFGIPEALLLAFAATGVLAFVTGALTGAAVLTGPALLALLVGLVLSHLTMPVATAVGRRALLRGDVRTGLSLLDAARSPALRRTVAVLTVATALLVFAADAAVVGARNRERAAEQFLGAPRVLTIGSTDVAGVRAAVREADPSGHRATTVVKVPPPGDGTTTLAVVPDEFRQIAFLDGLPRLPLSDLAAPTARPIRIVADRVAVEVRDAELGGAGRALIMSVVFAGGGPGRIRLGTLPRTTHAPVTLRTPVSCRAGCIVSGLGVQAAIDSRVTGSVTLGPLVVHRPGGGTSTVPLGPAGQWHRAPGEGGPPDRDGDIAPRTASGGGLALDVDTQDAQSVNLEQDWLSSTVPAIVAGALPPASRGNEFAMLGLDATARAATRVHRAARIPSGPPDTALVNLDAVERGSAIDGLDQVFVWLGSTDRALAARVRAALADHHLTVTDDRTVGDQRTTYDRSAAAWSLALGVVAGGVALAIALVVMVVIAVTTWRTRTRDLAALRMAGLSRRRIHAVAIAGQLLAVAVAVLAGALTGLVGAQLALDGIPLFTRAPAVGTLDLATSWPAVLVAGAVALLVLAVTGLAIGRRLARNAVLPRLREAA